MSTETDENRTDADDYTNDYSETHTNTDTDTEDAETDTEGRLGTGTGIGGGPETDVPWSTDEAGAAQARLVTETSPVQTEEADGELTDGELADGELVDGELGDGELIGSDAAGADMADRDLLDSNEFDENESEFVTEPGSARMDEAYENDDNVFPALGLAADSNPAQQGAAFAQPQTGLQPLLAAEVESDLLERWTGIQSSFVEDPRQSVRDADSLIQEIAATLSSAVQDRRSDLAAQWREDSGDTEELRQTLRQYRAFVGVLLPK